ncbi:MAG: bifunctional (p)ppGpp synthetase/guanosine-3',5'-bis(diphosphate) 3'-pyrophosphohydrolase, partial [Clostridiales bacterium]|nr:bifunctional (p)ppGpp synthetase/guanosine-3',5'-bis(diphosphate) 3'-pyrophosphohydrolase [Clostridiales bacterium]
RLGYTLPQLTKPDFLETVCRRYTLNSLEDLYMTVGFGGLSSSQVLNRLVEEYKKANKIPDALPLPKPLTHAEAEAAREQAQRKSASHQTHGVVVEGDPGMLVRFARCCNPLPGDAIIGYITRGRGVSVHRSDCTNMQADDVEPERMVRVGWEGDTGGAYEAEIQIVAYDRIGLFADISLMLSQMEVPIVAISARTNRNTTTTLNLTLSIKNTQQLEKIIKQLLKRSDIIEVFRVSN